MKINLHEDLLNLFKKQGGYLNKNLIIKKDVEKGFGIISDGDILPDTLLIDVPHNLLIPVKELKSLTNFKNTFEEIFFETIISGSESLNNHPLISNNFELKIINDVLKNNVNLNKNFLIKHKVFNYLAEEKKKIELLSYTRAIFIEGYNKKFFMPIMDFINYHFEGLNFSTGKNGNVYLKSTKHIKKNEEILINYAQSTDAISFFFEQGFTDKSFNSFKIKKNELRLKLNNISTFNKKYFSKDNDIYTFKEDILFNKNNISQNISSFLEIFQPKDKQEMLMKILKMYKNSISMNLEDQNIGKDSIILKKFFKSVELYTNIIDNYLELIAKKNEKN